METNTCNQSLTSNFAKTEPSLTSSRSVADNTVSMVDSDKTEAMAITSNGIPSVTGPCFVPGVSGSASESFDPCDSSAMVIQPEEFRIEDAKKQFKVEFIHTEQEFYLRGQTVVNGLIDIKPEPGLDYTEPCDQHRFIDIKPPIGEVGIETSSEEVSVEVCFLRPGRRNHTKRKLSHDVQPKSEPLPISTFHRSDFIPGPEMLPDKETEFKQEIKSEVSPSSASMLESCPVSPKRLKLLKRDDDRMEIPEEDRNFTCEMCGEYFRTAYYWARHMVKYHPETNWKKCSYCGMEFKKRLPLVRHIKRHQKQDEKHPCDICGARFKSKEFLPYHKAEKHGGPLPRKCKECGERFLTAQELTDHSKEKHVEIVSSKKAVAARNSQKCNYCPKLFKISYRRIRHKHIAHTRVHIPEVKPFKCDFCDSRFKLQRRKVFHMVTKHRSPMPYICANCGEGFVSTGKMEKHITDMHAVPTKTENGTSRDASCELTSELKRDQEVSGVSEKFNTNKAVKETELKTEKSNEGKDECHICFDCGVAYTTKLRLLTHACKCPEHVTPQICPICMEGFNSQHGYDGHVAEHNVDDECICLMCPERFETCFKRNKHIRSVHLREAFMQCIYCSETFPKRKQVLRHEKSHTTIPAVLEYRRRYIARCKLCRDQFESSTLLTYHILTVHGGATPYSCELCKEEFSCEQDLNAHVKNAHQDYPEVESSNPQMENETSNSLDD